MKVVDDTNGFRVLSHINFVSISVTVAATLLGLTGFVFAIKFNTHSEKKKLCLVVPGLQNLGNNCFLNVILQISLDFQFFHTLPLSVISNGSTVDSLRDFIGVEQVENYRCSHCWHTAAVKYVSTIVSYKTEIEKLRTCSREDSGACRSLSCLEKLPWSNKFSRTLKQLTIARSPKILYFHLQRASLIVFGELVKLQGHIAFPLILNLSPYMTTGVGVKHREENVCTGHANSQLQPTPNHLNLTFDANMLNTIYGLNSRVLVSNETSNMVAIRGGENNLIKSEVSHNTMCTNTSTKPDSKESISKVVGSGHYTVYRRVQAESDEADHDECLEPALPYWFRIPDSEVQSVSVEDVLTAEASLLFYERIGDD